MAEAIRLEIVTPAGVVMAEDVSYVQAPGSNGLLGILKNHAPLMTALEIGAIKYTKNGEDHFLDVAGGFLEVKDNRVIILSPAAERAEDIDMERAQAAEQRARRRLRSHEAGVDVHRAELALARAMNRQRVHKKI